MKAILILDNAHFFVTYQYYAAKTEKLYILLCLPMWISPEPTLQILGSDSDWPVSSLLQSINNN